MPFNTDCATIGAASMRAWKSRRRSILRLSPGRVLVKSSEKSDGMKRGTPAAMAASSSLALQIDHHRLEPVEGGDDGVGARTGLCQTDGVVEVDLPRRCAGPAHDAEFCR